jgi:hypothetical protein
MDDIDTSPWILFHTDIFEKISPLLEAEGFKLIKKRISPPATLIYERKATTQHSVARIIIHGGGYFPSNRIYIQASSGDFHLTDVTELIENFISSSIFGGWGYTTKEELLILLDELAVFVKEKLLTWINQPFTIQKPIDLSQLSSSYLDDLKKSLEIEKGLVQRFREEGNPQAAQKWEKSVNDKQQAIKYLERNKS